MKQNWCDKSKLNLSIDILLLLLLMSMAGIGFLIKYVLLPGTERNARYGSEVDLEFWGMDRHEWGSVHLIISIIFLVFLLFHILFHWKMIVGIFRRMIPNALIRTVSATLITGISILLITFPIFVKPEIIERDPLHQNKHGKHLVSERPEVNNEPPQVKADSINPEIQDQRKHQPGHEALEELGITGSQTLQEVADHHGIPATVLAADLQIPASRAAEKLGRLRKQYTFTMDDVRKSILKHKK